MKNSFGNAILVPPGRIRPQIQMTRPAMYKTTGWKLYGTKTACEIYNRGLSQGPGRLARREMIPTNFHNDRRASAIKQYNPTNTYRQELKKKSSGKLEPRSSLFTMHSFMGCSFLLVTKLLLLKKIFRFVRSSFKLVM